MVATNALTQKEYDVLTEELENLKKNERPAVIKAISTAREHGDLKENAEYHAAKEKQSHIETKIMGLETKLYGATVINEDELPKDSVVLGATVKLKDNKYDEEITYKIVSMASLDINREDEITPISIASKVGQALIGKKVGDEVEIDVPAGKLKYSILDIC